ncbi:unnamed protein product [Thelazia callipaeda]|uniref:Uncharacterized protein n=1 Tax=Thelazia callipaeda TaxID=103827 RepID=A0A0N5D903_THECL|nr:unnamed protein product [Thelazia callipaeda]
MRLTLLSLKKIEAEINDETEQCAFGETERIVEEKDIIAEKDTEWGRQINRREDRLVGTERLENEKRRKLQVRVWTLHPACDTVCAVKHLVKLAGCEQQMERG